MTPFEYLLDLYVNGEDVPIYDWLMEHEEDIPLFHAAGADAEYDMMKADADFQSVYWDEIDFNDEQREEARRWMHETCIRHERMLAILHQLNGVPFITPF